MNLSKEQLKKLIDELFNYYRKVRVTEEEFTTYLKTKGYGSKEVSKIRKEAELHDLLRVGVLPKMLKLECKDFIIVIEKCE